MQRVKEQLGDVFVVFVMLFIHILLGVMTTFFPSGIGKSTALKKYVSPPHFGRSSTCNLKTDIIVRYVHEKYDVWPG